MGSLPGSAYLLPALVKQAPGAAGTCLSEASVTTSEGLALLLAALGLSLALERRSRLQALRRSEAQLLGFIRHAPAAIAFKDPQGRFLLLNARMEAKIGLPATEILGKVNETLFPDEVCAPLRERDAKVLRFRQEVQVEERWPSRQDGGSRDYLSHKFPLLDERGACWGMGLIETDITERKRSDEALLQSQKLESLGILAGGIAHDFNNLLTAMRGNLHGARSESSVAGVRPYLDSLDELMENASGLLNQMLLFAGRGGSAMRAIDLNPMVSGMVKLLRASLSRKAAVRLDLQAGPMSMCADPSQIQQMIMNLLINASEALLDREGAITLRTAREDLSESFIRKVFPGQELRPGCHIALDVSDNGHGMTPDVLAKIFDPFFTTKFKGRGLGLAAIRGVVRNHRGGIQVESTPGLGTLFRLRFPCSGKEGTPSIPWEQDCIPSHQGGPPDSAARGPAKKAPFGEGCQGRVSPAEGFRRSITGEGAHS